MRMWAGLIGEENRSPGAEVAVRVIQLGLIGRSEVVAHLETVGGEAQIPFGGVKSSGVGDREQGPTALDFYTDVKVVYIDYTGTARTSKFY